VWMGGTDAASEGTWVWSPSNTPLSYTNWPPGQPDDHGGGEDCLMFNWGSSPGAWNDGPCTITLKYVCQTACPPPVASTGPCKASGNCACSSNYDASCTSPSGTYNNYEECTVTFPPSSLLTSSAFSTESRYDKVTVNGVPYSGSTGPYGVVASSMTWSSDHSVVRPGWKICAECTMTLCAHNPDVAEMAYRHKEGAFVDILSVTLTDATGPLYFHVTTEAHDQNKWGRCSTLRLTFYDASNDQQWMAESENVPRSGLYQPFEWEGGGSTRVVTAGGRLALTGNGCWGGGIHTRNTRATFTVDNCRTATGVGVCPM
jgi:hypothetical protein